MLNTFGSVEAAPGCIAMLGDRKEGVAMLGARTEGVAMLGERTEGGGSIEALLKRKSLLERHAKLTPETTTASADTVTASQPHAGLLPAAAPRRGRQSAMQGSPRPRQKARGRLGEGVEGAATASDSMPRSRLVGDELRLGGSLDGVGGICSPWTQQECAWREEGAEAAAVGNDRDNLKSCKSCALVNVKGRESVVLVWPSVRHAAGDARKPGRGTSHEAAHAEPGVKEVTEVANRHHTMSSPAARAPGCLAGACWWPGLALLLALLVPAALGLPAVIRIGKCYSVARCDPASCPVLSSLTAQLLPHIPQGLVPSPS